MAENNATIADRVFLKSSNDYQQRIGAAGIDGITRVQERLLDPNNGQYFNEFVKGLAIMIGTQKAVQLNWRNPLAVFKKDWFTEGKGAQEFATHLINPLQYNPEDTGLLLRNHKLDVESAFYSVNRRVVYPVTVNSAMVRASFNNTSSGLNDYINLMLNAPFNSDQYDEYRFMLQTFAAANGQEPFYNVEANIADVNNPTETEIKRLSRLIRTVGRKMEIAPTGLYNSRGVPVVTSPDKLVLLITPEIRAAMDVEVLADAFNMGKADFVNRIIDVDEFPWADTHAILMDENAFIAGDFITQIEHFRNGGSLTDNYFYHRQGGYAVSAFGNIAVFSNTASTQIGIVEFTLDDIELSFEQGGQTVSTAAPGSQVQLVVEADGTITPPNDKFIVPGSYTTSIVTSTGADVNARTFVNSNGVLYVGADTPTGTVLAITVTASYRDPSAPIGTPTTPVTDTQSITIS